MTLRTITRPGTIIRGTYRGRLKPYVRAPHQARWSKRVKAYHADRDCWRLHFDRVFREHGCQQIQCPYKVGLVLVVPPTQAGYLPGNKGDWDNYFKALLDALAWAGTKKRPETPFVPGDDLRWFRGPCDVGGVESDVYLGTPGQGWQMRWQVETVGDRLWIEASEMATSV